MFFHHKELAYKVRVDKPNPVFARMLQQAIGGPEGEMRSEKVDDVVTNRLVSARMGGIEPRHFLSAGLAAMPSDANGVPFTAACIDVGGNLLANLAAESIGRTLAARLREMTDAHGGIEATRTRPAGNGGGIAEKVKETVADKLT